MDETKTFVFPENCSGNNDAMLLSAMNGSMGNQWNNPFIYLVWMMFAQRMWNNNGLEGNAQSVELQNQIESLRSQMSNNQNSELVMDAIKGNGCAINQLASNLNCDFNTLNGAICDVRGGIDRLSGQVGFSSEKVINAITLGNANLTSALQNCCCTTQKSILEMGYQNQIANLNQTNTLSNAINNVATGQDRGFSTVSYASAQQTCELKQNADCNTRAILAKLDAIEDSRKDREIAALTATNASLMARAERQAELAPINAALAEIQCKQPQTVTLPYSCATAIPTGVAYANGFYGGLFNNGSLWA